MRLCNIDEFNKFIASFLRRHRDSSKFKRHEEKRETLLFLDPAILWTYFARKDGHDSPCSIAQ